MKCLSSVSKCLLSKWDWNSILCFYIHPLPIIVLSFHSVQRSLRKPTLEATPPLLPRHHRGASVVKLEWFSFRHLSCSWSLLNPISFKLLQWSFYSLKLQTTMNDAKSFCAFNLSSFLCDAEKVVMECDGLNIQFLTSSPPQPLYLIVWPCTQTIQWYIRSQGISHTQ